VEAAARAAGVGLERLEWDPHEGFGSAFHAATTLRLGGVLVLGDGATHFNRHAIFEAAAERRMPVMYDFPMFPAAEDVVLIAYYADVTALFRTVAEQVDSILRGRRPGDIPVASPQRFRLMINGKAARALGLTISPALRQEADQVLE
jgi:putative tryptophan/tyrosine transport system substrate-binding protein